MYKAPAIKNNNMNRKFWQLGFFMIVLTLTNVTEVQGQLWNRVKKHFAFAEEYDENVKFKIGIYMGGVSSNYIIAKKKDWYIQGLMPGSTPDIGTFTAIASKSGLGFNLGIPIDYRLKDYLNLTLSPGFKFGSQHKIIYSGTGPDETVERQHEAHVPPSAAIPPDPKINSNFPVFELPVHIKVRSEKKYMGHNPNPYSLYILGGAKYSNHLGTKGYYEDKFNPQTTNVPLIVKPDYFSYEFGLGLDMYFTYFKFSPEIRFSQSLGNLMDKNRTFPTAPGYQNPFMNAIDRLSLRSLQISLIFE